LAAGPVVSARQPPARVIGTSQTRAVAVRSLFAATPSLLFASSAAFGQTSTSTAFSGASPSPGAPTASYIVASQLLRWLGGRDLPNAFAAVTAFF